MVYKYQEDQTFLSLLDDYKKVSDDHIIFISKSGGGKCLEENSLVADTYTGELITIKEAYRRKKLLTLTLSDKNIFVERFVSDFMDNGIKECFEITTFFGRRIIVTPNHPFLARGGWKSIDEGLSVGEYIATTRNINLFGNINDEDDAIIFGALITDGCLRYPRGNIGFSNSDPEILSVLNKALCVYDSHLSKKKSSLYDYRVAQNKAMTTSKLGLYLKRLKLYGLYSYEKFVPEHCFRYNKESTRKLLQMMFSCDGSVSKKKSKNTGYGSLCIDFTSTSEKMARQVVHLLTRFGIHARIRERDGFFRDKNGFRVTRRKVYNVTFNKPNTIRYVEKIGFIGEKQRKATSMLATMNQKYNNKLTRTHYEEVGDIVYDQIIKIEAVGQKQTYDLTIPELHNFVANDIVVHNTLAKENVLLELKKLGYIVISFDNMKNEQELGYSMFPIPMLENVANPDEPSYKAPPYFKPSQYQLDLLKKMGRLPKAEEVDLFHPFSSTIPRKRLLPDTKFYTLPIKELSEEDFSSLAETGAQNEAVNIMARVRDKLKQNEGIAEFIFYCSKETTQLMRNVGGRRIPIPRPPLYLTEPPAGTSKDIKYLISLLEPLLKYPFLDSEDSQIKLDIKRDLFSNQERIKFFYADFLPNKKMWLFNMQIILNLIIKYKNYCKYPLAIDIGELAQLTPSKPKEYQRFFGENYRNILGMARNIGRGMKLVGDSQVAWDIQPEVVEYFTCKFFGVVSAQGDLANLSKIIKLDSDTIKSMQNLGKNQFLMQGDEENDIFFMGVPTHLHKEREYNFYEMYHHFYQDKEKVYAPLINEMKERRAKVEEFLKNLAMSQFKGEETEAAGKSKEHKLIEKQKEAIEKLQEKMEVTVEMKRNEVMKKCFELVQLEALPNGDKPTYRAIARFLVEDGLLTKKPHHKTVEEWIKKYKTTG